MSSKAEEQIAAHLAARGQTLQEIRRLVFSPKLLFGRGVSNIASAYRATAVSADGTVNTYTLAYDPLGGSVGQRSGLKRYQNGQWVDAI